MSEVFESKDLKRQQNSNILDTIHASITREILMEVEMVS